MDRNADLQAVHASHPGWTADGCPARMAVTQRSGWGVTGGGFACMSTGEHCLPGKGCDAKRTDWAEFLKQADAEARTHHG